MLSEGHEALPPSQVIFDGTAAAATLARLRARVKLTSAREHLGAPSSQAALLLEAGLIEVDPTEPRTKGNPIYVTKASIDALLARLHHGAMDRVEAGPGELSIFAASKAARRPLAEMVDLVVQGRLRWVGRLVNEKGLAATLVRKTEVMAALGFTPNTEITKRDVCNALRLSYEAVAYLVEGGHIKARKVRQTRMEFLFDVIEPEAMREFDAVYASAAQLAQERGLHPNRLRRLLAESGVEPAFAIKDLNCAIFRRRDVPTHLY